VIRHRLDLYHEQTEAVVAKYAERGILTQVDGIGGIDEVTDRVLQSRQLRRPDPASLIKHVSRQGCHHCGVLGEGSCGWGWHYRCSSFLTWTAAFKGQPHPPEFG
jgi:hypothetical protein